MAQPKISGGKDTLLRPHAITDGPGHEERDPRNKTGGLGTEPGVGESGGPSTMGTGWLLCPERGGGGPSPDQRTISGGCSGRILEPWAAWGLDNTPATRIWSGLSMCVFPSTYPPQTWRQDLCLLPHPHPLLIPIYSTLTYVIATSDIWVLNLN